MADKTHPVNFTRKEINELEKAGKLTPFSPVSFPAVLLFSLVIDPAVAQSLSELSGKMDILADITTSDKTLALSIILYPVIVVITTSLADLLTSGARKRRREELAAIKANKEKADRIIEDYQSAIDLVSKCEEHGIMSAETEAEQAAIWVVAQSVGIANKEEALSLYSEAKNPSLETQTVLREKANYEKAERTTIAKKEDSDQVNSLNELYPPTLIGKDKYLTRIKRELQELEEKHKALLAVADYVGSGRAYIPAKPKNVTLEAAKGQLIGGPGLAAAKAISAENYNSSHSSGMPSASEMESATRWATYKRQDAAELEPRIEELKAQIADIEARLIDLDSQEKYAEFAQCKVEAFDLTEGGNIDAWISPVDRAIEGAAILDEPAIVDGSLIVKAWLNDEQIGQTVYCPDGFDGDLSHAGFGVQRMDPAIILVSKELKPEDLESITITFEPKTIWAIQKNPAA